MNILVFANKNGIKVKNFSVLTWETALMCVFILGNESEKSTETKSISSIVFSVLPEFYEKMNKRPLLFVEIDHLHFKV